MNNEWTQFLQAHPEPAQFTDQNTPAWVLLKERASLLVTGEEAGDFLQAMLTQEILSLDDSHAARGALCNAKGRILSTLLVHPFYPAQNTNQSLSYRLTVPTDLANDLLKTLRLYVLRRRVTIEISEDWPSVGLLNPDPSLLDRLGINRPLPDNLSQSVLSSGVIATREHIGGNERISLQGSATSLLALTAQLPQRTAQNTWDCAEIQDGIPSINKETSLHFVPQWINLDQLNAVSFKKGCYPGQEVIARLHYLGKSNRRMVNGYARTNSPIEAKSVIHPVNEPDADAGEIVRSAFCKIGDEQVQVFLAVMRLGHLHDELVIDGQPCTLRPSPFLESEAQQH